MTRGKLCKFANYSDVYVGENAMVSNARSKCLMDLEAARMGLWFMLMQEKQMHLAHHILIDAYRLQVMLMFLPDNIMRCNQEEWTPFESQRNNLIGTIQAVRTHFAKNKQMNKLCSRLDQVVGFLKAFRRDRLEPADFLLAP